MSEFLRLIMIGCEFAFKYNGSLYEVVWNPVEKKQYVRSLYLNQGDRAILIKSYDSNEDLIENGEIQGKKIKDIQNEIEL